MEGSILATSRNYDFVQGDDKAVYFMHHHDVAQGIHLIVVGQRVSFDTAPPLPGKQYARAINAVVGAPAATATPEVGRQQ